MIGAVRDASRFPDRDHFAAYNGTAPIEVSSGNRRIYRLSRRGNRRLNHVIHMAAVTQIRHRHSDGRAYYDRKLAEGKTPKQALRALKRRVSDRHLRPAPGRRPPGRSQPTSKSPGGQQGNDSVASAAGSHPRHRLFGQATPGSGTTLPIPASSPEPEDHLTRHQKPRQTLLTQRGIAMGRHQLKADHEAVGAESGILCQSCGDRRGQSGHGPATP